MSIHPHLLLDINADETPSSYASRQALYLGRTNVQFSRDCGTSFRGIVEGEAGALAALCTACRLAPEHFAKTAFVRQGPERVYRVAGEDFPIAHLAWSTRRICPACVREDCASPLGRLGAYERFYWRIDAVRVCEKHGRLLVPFGPLFPLVRTHDFAWHVDAHFGDGSALLSEATETAPSGLTKHLRDRVEGTVMEPWLLSMPAYAVGVLSEVVGAMMSLGVKYNMRAVKGLAAHEAGRIGFDLISAGPEALLRWFSELYRRHFSEASHNGGTQVIYGRLYQLLQREVQNDAYAPMRDLLRDHMVSTTAIGAGSIVLGKSVDARKKHSIRSLELEWGIHSKTLRKILPKIGVVDGAALSKTDDQVVFDAEAASHLRGALNQREAARFLNIKHPHYRSIVRPPLVPALVSPGDQVGMFWFQQAELDAFLDRVTFRAKPLARSERLQFTTIYRAASRSCQLTATVVRFLADDRLGEVRVVQGQRGLSAVRVDPNEIKRLARNDAMTERLGGHGWLDISQTQKRLHVTHRCATALFDNDIFETQVKPNPISNQPLRFANASDIEAFASEYITLHELTRETGVHFARLLKQLKANHVDLAFPNELVRNSFYRRADIATVRDKLT